MSPESFSERLLRVEDQVSTLQGVPKKVEELTVEVSQRRDETRAAVSAIQADMAVMRAAINVMRTDIDVMRTDIDAMRNDIAEIRVELAAMHIEIREGDEETRRQMRVLHEEVISRIAMLQEALVRPPRKSRRKM